VRVPDLVRELDRLESLLTYGVLGGAGPDLSDTVALAAQVCGTASAALGFLFEDRIEIHTAHGAPTRPIPREMSLSVRAVERGEPIVLGDLHDVDPAHPFVAGGRPIRAFAGVPLVGRDGLAIGVLAVHHHRTLRFTDAHIDALKVLAGHIMTRLELHRLDSWGGRALPSAVVVEPTRVREGLEAGELVPFLQPIVDLRTRATVGVEALIRWQHPEHGLIAPNDFLPVIEASGLMLPVGRQVRQRALDALAQIRALGPATSAVWLNVNMAPIELARPQLAAEVLDDLAERGLRTDALVVEVTETAAFVDPDAAVAQLRALHDAGVRVALDDYGAGHSSLTRLLSLPLSVLKLDRALVSQIPQDSRLGTAVASTIAMAADLGLDVVAEGVETQLQAGSLQSMGCGFAQGWHFGRAESVDTTVAALDQETRRAVRSARRRPAVGPRIPGVPRPAGEARAPDVGHVLADIAEAAYVVDLDRRIFSWNQAAEQVTGYRAEDVIGRRCADGLLNHVDEQGQQLCGAGCPLLATMEDGRERRTRVWLHHRKGHLVPVVISATAVRDAAGATIGAVETFYDGAERQVDGPADVPAEYAPAGTTAPEAAPGR
jgi:PAS domain S-box-containing protein